MAIQRRCLDCRILCNTPRCKKCQGVYERARGQKKRAGRPYTHAERVRRAATVQAWVQQHGWTCPGWQRPPHPVAAGALAADHPHAVGAGGDEGQPLAVLCIVCNGAKGARV